MGKPQLETLWLWQVPGIQAGDSHSLLFWASWYTSPSHFAGIERWPGKNIKNWHKPPCTTQRAIIRMWQGQKRQRDSLVCPFPSLPCRGQIVSRLSWANKLRLPMRIVRICSAFSFFFPRFWRWFRFLSHRRIFLRHFHVGRTVWLTISARHWHDFTKPNQPTGRPNCPC